MEVKENEKVQQLEKRLEALNNELEAFSYSVSHDLRAPLRAIDSYSSILEEEYNKVLDAEGKRLLGIVRYNAQKLGALIDNLLSYSRLGRTEIQITSIDMNELVAATLREFEQTNSHNAVIKIHKLSAVNGDYLLISQAVMNLLSNSIKFSSKKEKPEIEIYSEKTDHDVTYFFKDNGVGFDPKYAHKLFGVFQRQHKLEDFEGTGMGLAIVKRIVTMHGGIVGMRAEPDNGAIFHFSLPL